MIIFQKKLFGSNGPFWAKKWGIFTTLGGPQEFVVNFAQQKWQTGR